MKKIYFLLIIITNVCLSQTYQSNYVGTYKVKSSAVNINSKSEIYVGDMMKEIMSSANLFTYTLSVISNNKYSIIKVGINYMALPINDNYETEIFFVDYANHTIYNLNKKTFSEYIPNKLDPKKNVKDAIYEQFSYYKADTAIITFDKTLPKQLGCKSFLNEQEFGIRKIVTKQDEVVLVKYIETEFNFNEYLINMKKVCTLKGKKINYLFGI